MPCYQVIRYDVSFVAENRELLEKALDALGWSYDYDTTGNNMFIAGGIVLNLKEGKARVTDYQQQKLNRLKQEYSWQAVQKVAKKKKWYIKSKGARKYQVRRY